jgi:hypothetical protein
VTTPLAIQLTIDSPGTAAFTLNNLAAGYELEASTLEEIATTWRKQQVDNVWTEGSYTVSAVRENQSVPVSVWVRGATHQQMRQRLLVVQTAVGRPQWAARLTLGSPAYTEHWTCQTSDYVVRTQREFQHATMALLKINVVRLPTVRYVYSDGSEVKA